MVTVGAVSLAQSVKELAKGTLNTPTGLAADAAGPASGTKTASISVTRTPNMTDQVKAARERLKEVMRPEVDGVAGSAWTATVSDLRTVLADHARLVGEVERVQALVTASEQQRNRDCSALLARAEAAEAKLSALKSATQMATDILGNVAQGGPWHAAREVLEEARAALDHTVPAEEGEAHDSRRCLICANINPCREHGAEAQAAELDRNDRAIAALKAPPAVPAEEGEKAAQAPMPRALPMPEYRYQQDDFSGGSVISSARGRALPISGHAAVPAQDVAGVDREGRIIGMMRELHANIPEDQRPIARMDFSDEQWARAERAYDLAALPIPSSQGEAG